jgi:hypothetical protein
MNPGPAPFDDGCGSEGDSSHVGAGVRDVLMICHDELRLCAFVTAVPESSRSKTKIRFSLLLPFPCGAAVELEGDFDAVLLELVEGCGAGRRGLEGVG